jgi:hypothetical protein
MAVKETHRTVLEFGKEKRGTLSPLYSFLSQQTLSLYTKLKRKKERKKERKKKSKGLVAQETKQNQRRLQLPSK